MEILQLKYFCHAAKTQNFSHTANAFNVPPSSISQSIKRLEEELGTKLFNRNHNSIVLNNNGLHFYQKINKALSIIESAKSQLETLNEKEQISVCALTNRQLVMQAIEKLHTLYPHITVVINHHFSNTVKYDMVIADQYFSDSKMPRRFILSEKIALAIHKENPLAKKDEISVSDLKAESFIGFCEESSLYKVTAKNCQKLKFTPNYVIQSPDPFYVRKCVELNLGIAFVPTFSWKGLFSNEVVIKNIGNFNRQTYAYLNDTHPKKSVENLLNLLMTDTVKY